MGALPIFRQYHMHATYYVPSGLVCVPDTDPDCTRTPYLTLQDVRTLAAAGNEIGGLTVLHLRLTRIPAAEAAREICQDRVNLTGWGMQVTDFAYPFAQVTKTLQDLVRRCGYNTALGAGELRGAGLCDSCGWAETIPPHNPYLLRAPIEVASVGTRWTAATFESIVTGAQRHGGGWIIFNIHDVCAQDCALGVTKPELSSVLAWLAGPGQPRGHGADRAPGGGRPGPAAGGRPHAAADPRPGGQQRRAGHPGPGRRARLLPDRAVRLEHGPVRLPARRRAGRRRGGDHPDDRLDVRGRQAAAGAGPGPVRAPGPARASGTAWPSPTGPASRSGSTCTTGPRSATGCTGRPVRPCPRPSEWTQTSWDTPALPRGATAVSFGLAIGVERHGFGEPVQPPAGPVQRHPAARVRRGGAGPAGVLHAAAARCCGAARRPGPSPARSRPACRTARPGTAARRPGSRGPGPPSRPPIATRAGAGPYAGRRAVAGRAAERVAGRRAERHGWAGGGRQQVQLIRFRAAGGAPRVGVLEDGEVRGLPGIGTMADLLALPVLAVRELCTGQADRGPAVRAGAVRPGQPARAAGRPDRGVGGRGHLRAVQERAGAGERGLGGHLRARCTTRPGRSCSSSRRPGGWPGRAPRSACGPTPR